MGAIRSGGGPACTAFDGWLSRIVAMVARTRDAELIAWTRAPSARESHPREEHLLPLIVAAGAAEDDPGAVVFRDVGSFMPVGVARCMPEGCAHARHDPCKDGT